MQQRPRKGPLFFVVRGHKKGRVAAAFARDLPVRLPDRNQRLDHMLHIGLKVLAGLLGLLQLQ